MRDLILSDIDFMYFYNNEYVVFNQKDDNTFYRSIYNSTSERLIGEVQDKIMNNNLFIRNNNLSILNNALVKVESENKLATIKYKSKSLKDEPNPFIGSWDVETFIDSDGYVKVYALGFYVLGGSVKSYYLDDTMTSEELVLKYIDDMLINNYKGYTFYIHNFGRYDSTFLIKILKEYNLKMEYEH